MIIWLGSLSAFLILSAGFSVYQWKVQRQLDQKNKTLTGVVETLIKTNEVYNTNFLDMLNLVKTNTKNMQVINDDMAEFKISVAEFVVYMTELLEGTESNETQVGPSSKKSDKEKLN